MAQRVHYDEIVHSLYFFVDGVLQKGLYNKGEDVLEIDIDCRSHIKNCSMYKLVLHNDLVWEILTNPQNKFFFTTPLLNRMEQKNKHGKVVSKFCHLNKIYCLI